LRSRPPERKKSPTKPWPSPKISSKNITRRRNKLIPIISKMKTSGKKKELLDINKKCSKRP
jgi:hypothetical protein